MAPTPTFKLSADESFRRTAADDPVGVGTYLGKLALATRRYMTSDGLDFEDAILLASGVEQAPDGLDFVGLSAAERRSVAILLGIES